MYREDEIIERVKNGDVNAFSLLVEKHSNNTYALAKSMLKSDAEAEEVVQDVFVKAFKSLKNFRGDARFSSFLYRICYNECINAIRKRKMDYQWNDEISEHHPETDGFFDVKYQEQKKFLKIALESLNPEMAMILTLFYLEELRYNEIVEATGWSLANVKVRLHRAKGQLKIELEKLLKEEVESLI